MTNVSTFPNPIDSHRTRHGKPIARHSDLHPSDPALRRLAADQPHAIYAQARRLREQTIRELAAMLRHGIAAGTRWLTTTATSSLLAVGEALAARRSYEELSRLSNHELADMGLTRGDISAVAWRQSRRLRARVTPAEVSERIVQQESREAA